MDTSTSLQWPFAPVPRGGTITKAELTRRQEALAQAPLFGGINKRNLRELASVTAISSFPEGSLIVKEGSPGTTFYVILEGRAKVIRSGRTLNKLGPGDFFGEVALLDGGPRTATVVSQDPVRSLTLAKRDFERFLLKQPRVSLIVLAEVARRLRQGERPRLY